MKLYEFSVVVAVILSVAITGVGLVCLVDMAKSFSDIAWELGEIRISIDSQTDTVDAIVDEVMTDLDDKLPGWAWGGK